MSKSKIKIMFICFFDVTGIIHLEFIPEGTAVNQDETEARNDCAVSILRQ
jgi:hypothetical protein